VRCNSARLKKYENATTKRNELPISELHLSLVAFDFKSLKQAPYYYFIIPRHN
jgi:hypothetical protein